MPDVLTDNEKNVVMTVGLAAKSYAEAIEKVLGGLEEFKTIGIKENDPRADDKKQLIDEVSKSISGLLHGFNKVSKELLASTTRTTATFVDFMNTHKMVVEKLYEFNKEGMEKGLGHYKEKGDKLSQLTYMISSGSSTILAKINSAVSDIQKIEGMHVEKIDNELRAQQKFRVKNTN